MQNDKTTKINAKSFIRGIIPCNYSRLLTTLLLLSLTLSLLPPSPPLLSLLFFPSPTPFSHQSPHLDQSLSLSPISLSFHPSLSPTSLSLALTIPNNVISLFLLRWGSLNCTLEEFKKHLISNKIYQRTVINSALLHYIERYLLKQTDNQFLSLLSQNCRPLSGGKNETGAKWTKERKIGFSGLN